MASNVRFIDYLVRPSTNMIFMNTAGSNTLVLAKVEKGKLRIANFCVIQSCPLLAKYGSRTNNSKIKFEIVFGVV